MNEYNGLKLWQALFTIGLMTVGMVVFLPALVIRLTHDAAIWYVDRQTKNRVASARRRYYQNDWD